MNVGRLKNKLGKTKIIIFSFAIALVIAMVSVSALYFTGKSVEDDIGLQWVSHTEYWRGDNASSIVRLGDYRGNPYIVDSCRVTILKPDKSIFVNDAAMKQSNIAGNWYRTDSLQGAPLGTYEQEVTCVKGSVTIKSSQSFHLNPALEQISVLTDLSNSLNTSLVNTSISLSMGILNSTQIISTELSKLNTNITDVIRSVNTTINQQFHDLNISLDTDLSSLDISIRGFVNSTGNEIKADIFSVNSSLNVALNTTQSALENQIIAIHANLSGQLFEIKNLAIQVQALVSGTNESLNVRLDGITTNLADVRNLVVGTNSSIKNGLDVLSQQITNNLSSISNNLNLNEQELLSRVSDINLSIMGQVTSTGQEISAQVSSVNSTLVLEISESESNVIANLSEKMDAVLQNLSVAVSGDLSSDLEFMRVNLTGQLNNLKSDTAWIVANAMNQEDMFEITQRFDRINNSLLSLETMCSGATNSSSLCAEIYNIKDAVATMDVTHQQAINSIQNTTTSTFLLLSGSVSSRIDSVLTSLGIIQQQTTAINQTTQQILEEIQGEVRISVIS